MFKAAVGGMIASEVNGERVVKNQDKCFFLFVFFMVKTP